MACGCTHSRPASSTHNVRNNKNLKKKQKKTKKTNKKFARGIRDALLITGHRSLYLLGHHIPSFIYFLAVSSSSRRRFWTSPQKKKKKKRELANNNEKKNNFSWFYTQLPVWTFPKSPTPPILERKNLVSRLADVGLFRLDFYFFTKFHSRIFFFLFFFSFLFNKFVVASFFQLCVVVIFVDAAAGVESAASISIRNDFHFMFCLCVR